MTSIDNILTKSKKIFLGSLLLSSSLFAGSDIYYDYARVTHSEPIYDYVYDHEPNRVCKEVRYKVRDNYDDRYYSSNKYDDSLGVDTLVGTAAGVVIGSQIGKGNGRVASQIVGGLLGAKVANDLRNNYKPKYDRRGYAYETRTECYDNPRRVQKKMLTGYKNFFVYNGEEHYKISNTPINRVRITHTIDF